MMGLHVDIQIWAPLTRSQCKISDTQVTVKVCGPLVLIKLFKVVICKMNEKLQWLNMNFSVLNTNPCCSFFLRTSQIMTITSTSSIPPPPPPAMPAIVPTDSPSSAEEQLIARSWPHFDSNFLNWYGNILWNLFIREPRSKLINSWYWTHIFTISSMIYFFFVSLGFTSH